MQSRATEKDGEKLLSKINPEEMGRVFKKALKQGFIKEGDTAVIFYDLSRLTGRIVDLKKVFPPSALHAIAIKANPLKKILRRVRALEVGAEAASLAELMLAEKSGFSPKKIVFDSPVKTTRELEYALKLGVHINLDNFQELERVVGLLENINSKSSIGIRINPQVGMGRIHSTSVAGEYSKFGIALKTHRTQLLESFLRYRWLRGVHLHVGSQGCEVDLLIKGVEKVFDFVEEVNESRQKDGGGPKVDIFDIGGGLPVSYHEGEEPLRMADYKKAIQSRCPKLFGDEYRLITEFGRYIHANVGWVASRVEYVKPEANIHTALIHVGADLFLRKCLNPEDWHYDMSVLDKDGKAKPGPMKQFVIAGPLCFSGDVVARGVLLHEIQSGDYILVHDTGAYTLSMWSRYNSREVPKVVGYREEGDEIQVLKRRERIEEVIDFWGE